MWLLLTHQRALFQHSLAILCWFFTSLGPNPSPHLSPCILLWDLQTHQHVISLFEDFCIIIIIGIDTANIRSHSFNHFQTEPRPTPSSLQSRRHQLELFNTSNVLSVIPLSYSFLSFQYNSMNRLELMLTETEMLNCSERAWSSHTWVNNQNFGHWTHLIIFFVSTKAI